MNSPKQVLEEKKKPASQIGLHLPKNYTHRTALWLGLLTDAYMKLVELSGEVN